jgi:hypothetical protein
VEDIFEQKVVVLTQSLKEYQKARRDKDESGAVLWRIRYENKRILGIHSKADGSDWL